MYAYYNPNPTMKNREDCIIRAITKVLGLDWDAAYMQLSAKGFEVKEMPSINWVWGAYLRDMGLERHAVPNTCPDCYTVKDFCEEHPEGAYILATGSHVVAAIDGSYFDSWDSGDEVVVYYFEDTEADDGAWDEKKKPDEKKEAPSKATK